MHVMLTVNSAWNVVNFRWPILQALLSRGDSVTVLAPPDHSVPLITQAGARFLPLKMQPGAIGLTDNARLLWQMFHVLKHEKPDIVLSWTIKNNIFGSLCGRILSIPVIPNISGLGTAFLSGFVMKALAKALYRIAFSRSRTVFFQNHEDLELFNSYRLVKPGASQLVSGSGIDLQRFAIADIPQQPFTFLMISRLLSDKGVNEFIEAARLVRRDDPSVRFRLVGDTGAANRTAIPAKQIAKWRAEGIVELPGPVGDVRAEIAAAHCVVLPSYREGAPRTLIEGAAMARPLIATDVPGCRSVVEAGQTGLLCASHSGLALAEAMRQMLGMSAERRANMGLAGRKKMENEFDELTVVSAYLDAIEENSANR